MHTMNILKKNINFKLYSSETGAIILRVHLELCSQQFYASAIRKSYHSHLIGHPPPPPSGQPSYHRVVRDLRARGDNPNNPPPLLPIIFGGVLEEDSYHLARRLLRGLMIGEITRTLAPNQGLMAIPSPMDPVEQLLFRSYKTAFSHLFSGH